MFVGYSWLIYLTTSYALVQGKPLIIRICDGEIMHKIMPAEKINGGIIAGYYIFVFGALILAFVGFYLLNHWQVKRRVRRGMEPDYYACGLDIFRNVADEWRRPRAIEPEDE